MTVPPADVMAELVSLYGDTAGGTAADVSDTGDPPARKWVLALARLGSLTVS